MTSFDTKQIDLLKALTALFYERIRPDARFRNKRIEEWCKNLPLPPISPIDCNDTDALAEVTVLHRQLELLDEQHSVKGFHWPGYVKKEFSEVLERLREKIKSSDIDPSVFNLFHVHNSVLLRAQGRYDEALRQLELSSKLLQRKIDTYDGYLPRYNREILLNLGASSELHRLNGNIEKAMALADEMLTLANEAGKNPQFVAQDKAGQCPVASWALYYSCEAQLAVKDWDNTEAKTAREWVFSHTFTTHAYRDWTVPVLIRILGNIVWEQRYPHYFDKIADLVYVGTASHSLKAAMRELSVYLGRVRPKPTMPITLLGLVVLLAVKVAADESKGSKTAADPRAPIERTIEELQGAGLELPRRSREEVEVAIQGEIRRRSSHDTSAEGELPSDELGMTDRGVGGGAKDEVHLLLPLLAFASDRGVGPG